MRFRSIAEPVRHRYAFWLATGVVLAGIVLMLTNCADGGQPAGPNQPTPLDYACTTYRVSLQSAADLLMADKLNNSQIAVLQRVRPVASPICTHVDDYINDPTAAQKLDDVLRQLEQAGLKKG